MEKTCVEGIHIVARMITRTTDHRESAELNTDFFFKKKEGSSSVCRVMATGSYQPIRPLNKQQIDVIQRFILFIQSFLFGPTHSNEKV